MRRYTTYLGLLVLCLALARGIVGGGLASLAELIRLLLQALLICFALLMRVDGARLVDVVVGCAGSGRRSGDQEESVVAFRLGDVVLGIGGLGRVGDSRERASSLDMGSDMGVRVMKSKCTYGACCAGGYGGSTEGGAEGLGAEDGRHSGGDDREEC